MKTYEGMFLLDAGQPNFDEAVQPIQAVLDRNEASVVHMKKWDERRLAYEIGGRRRGLYVLTYFKADPEAIGRIERDVQLNESILRVLILAADHVSGETMETLTPAEAESKRRQEAEAEETRKVAEAEQAKAEKAAEAEAPAEGEKPAEGEAPAEGEKPAEAEKPAEGQPAEAAKPAEGESAAPAQAEQPAGGSTEGESDKTAQ